MISKVIVELDLTGLDETIESIKQIKGINIDYYNVGEGQIWSESVPFKVVTNEQNNG